jgi:hypothetical protein
MGENTVDSKYLRILEPWGGGHNPTDTGFGNRLLHWDACYMLYMASGAEHFMITEHRYWHEMKYLEFPGTVIRNHFHHMEDMQQWLGTFHFDFRRKKITELPCVDDKIVEEYLNTGKIHLPEPRYYVKFSWHLVGKILEKADKDGTKSGLTRVHIKNREFQQKVSKFATNTVGIHLRRGNGVYKSNKNYKELPEKVKKNKHYDAMKLDTCYKYWEDNVYIRLMKEMLQYNPKQRFYLSCDLLDDEYEYLKEKFPGKILVRKDLIKELPKEVTNDVFFERYECKNRVALQSVVDMEVLKNCTFVLGAPVSTWLDAILRSKNVPCSTIKEGKDHILREYVNAYENYTTLV